MQTIANILKHHLLLPLFDHWSELPFCRLLWGNWSELPDGWKGEIDDGNDGNNGNDGGDVNDGDGWDGNDDCSGATFRNCLVVDRRRRGVVTM